MNQIHNFNNTYSTYWNDRPANGNMSDLQGGHWLHGGPNYTIYKRIFFIGSQAPFSGTFVAGDGMFSGFGITQEGYFFYFNNDCYKGYYGKADITIVAFW